MNLLEFSLPQSFLLSGFICVFVFAGIFWLFFILESRYPRLFNENTFVMIMILSGALAFKAADMNPIEKEINSWNQAEYKLKTTDWNSLELVGPKTCSRKAVKKKNISFGITKTEQEEENYPCSKTIAEYECGDLNIAECIHQIEKDILSRKEISQNTPKQNYE